MTEMTRNFQYRETDFVAGKTSATSATLNIACGLHEHVDFIIGIAESDEIGWIVGRPSSGYPHGGSFVDAVRHAADLLHEECGAMRQVDEFFDSDDVELDEELIEELLLEDLLPDDSDDDD